jgi:hypothetical protein
MAGARGRPVRGAIGGLIMGLGLALLLQQAGVWPLDPVSVYGLPLVLAIIGIGIGRTGAFGGGK